MEQLENLIMLLTGKDQNAGYGAMKLLEEYSRESDEVYEYMDQFISMIKSDRSSYIRNRGMCLFAANAQWDEEGRVEEALDAYLAHVEDAKPITARQCIQNLPKILEAKPSLAGRVEEALDQVNLSKYRDSMAPLIRQDITDVLAYIAEQKKSDTN